MIERLRTYDTRYFLEDKKVSRPYKLVREYMTLSVCTNPNPQPLPPTEGTSFAFNPSLPSLEVKLCFDTLRFGLQGIHVISV